MIDDEANINKKDYEKNKYIIDPESYFAFIWDSVLLLGRIYQCFVIPFRLSFGSDVGGIALVNTSNYILDVLFVLDIILKFRWGFMSKGDKVMVAKRIVAHRLHQKTFYTACLAAIPMETIMYLFLNKERNEFYAMNKLLRIGDLAKELRNLEKSFVVDPNAVRVIKLMFYASFVTHLTACTYKVSCEGLVSEFCHYATNEPTSRRAQYLSTIYWAWGMCKNYVSLYMHIL